MPKGWLLDAAAGADELQLLLVAESGPGIIDAFCLTTRVLDEASLLLIAVRPCMRGRGLGQVLLRATLKALLARGIVRCLLEVRRSNAVALSLYERCGFARYGVRRGYYPPCEHRDREDAIVMSWESREAEHGGS